MLHINRSTEEFLYSLLWLADKATKPTLSNLIGGSSYPLTSRQQLSRLEESGVVKKSRTPSGEWAYKITKLGSLAVLGGRNPAKAWARTWDGKWRIIFFDMPSDEVKTRRALLRWLRTHFFGCLQQSVWISPHHTDDMTDKLAEFNSSAVLMIEGAPPGVVGTQAEDIVTSAWDFEEINHRYNAYLAFTSNTRKANQSAKWRKEEHSLWRNAINIDPLLPEKLLPKNYLGRKAFTRRFKLLGSRDSQL